VLRSVAQVSDLTDAEVAQRVEGFWAYCKYLQTAYPDAVWINFDETPLWFSQRSRRTNVRRTRLVGRQPIRATGKASFSRKRITVGLAISTSPDFAREIPVFAVFRGEHDRRPQSEQWEGVQIPEGLEVHWQSSAWMNEELTGEWVGLLIQARNRVYGEDFVIVLVWDAFRAHLTEAVRILCFDNNIRVAVVPRGLTSLLQGLDTHINKGFKAQCRAWWRRWALAAVDPLAAELTNQSMVHMIRDAADVALNQAMPRGPLEGTLTACASFLQNGLTNAVDGSEDNLITVRHPAVLPIQRASIPASQPLPPASPAMGAIEDDPGYGSEWSDGEDASPEANDGEAGEGEVMRRIIVERDAWVDSLAPAAGSAAVGPRGFVGPSGARRSTRRVRPALPKQELFGGEARGSRDL
jgi:hypothetical protein